VGHTILVMFVFVFLLLAAPIVEIAVMVKVAEWIGTGQMLALLVSISVVGVWIVKRQGIGVLRRIRAEVDAGRIPGAHLVDGGLILVAGLLLVVPGFVTDCIGLILLLPPVRALVRGRLRRRFRIEIASGSRAGRGPGRSTAIDVEGGPARPTHRDPPQALNQ
jgi:UPF0716 protein FxsA